MKTFIPLTIVSTILLLIASNLPADSRKGNIELFIVLDKSLSMEEEIASVTSYVAEDLLTDMLIPGDMLAIINFYGKSELFYEGTHLSKSALDEVKREVKKIQADGRFTDIGSALDRLIRETSRIGGDESRKRYLLLLTDGKQEAPPESPYYSPDGHFNHELLKHTRVIARKGWKIHILGIGADTAAEELARELSAGYSEITIPEKSNETGAGAGESGEESSRVRQELSQALEGFSTWIEASLRKETLLLLRNNTLSLPLHLSWSSASEREEALGTITISEIQFSSRERSGEEDEPTLLLGRNIPIKLAGKESEGETDLDISLEIDEEVASKILGEGEIRFFFQGENSFQPAIFPLTLELQKPWYIRFWPIYPVILIVIVISLRMIIIASGKSKDDDDKRPKKPLV